MRTEDLTFHPTAGVKAVFGPDADKIDAAIINVRSKIAITCRTKLYEHIDEVVDVNDDSIGANVCILLRLMCRFLLMENPVRLSNLNELKNDLIVMWFELGFGMHEQS